MESAFGLVLLSLLDAAAGLGRILAFAARVGAALRRQARLVDRKLVEVRARLFRGVVLALLRHGENPCPSGRPARTLGRAGARGGARLAALVAERAGAARI